MSSSERDYIAARERRTWMAQEEKLQRDAADRAAYDRYVQAERNANAEVPPAQQVEPVSFAEFRAAMPEGEHDPFLRGTIATSVITLRRLGRIAIERLQRAELSDEELQMLGFDPTDRVIVPEAMSVTGIAEAFKHFAKHEPRYDFNAHYSAVTDFLHRNKLFPSDKHIALTFSHLYDLHLLPEPEPEPQPEPTPKVNLEIAPDPELERRKRREKYEREVVVIDPETGKGWTEYTLDHQADSETYRRLMKICRVYKNPDWEPKH